MQVALLIGGTTAFATTPTMSGVNLSGGDFGTSPISQVPGTMGTHYFYPSANHIDWAKRQGLELVRIPFRWERVHYDVNGVLEPTLHAPDIAALDTTLDMCEARGLRVILDMHNYAGRVLTIGGTKAGYSIGSPQLTIADFANTWRLLAAHFKDRACIWGYDLMNEPVGTFAANATNLTAMYQAAVNAIREVDTTHAVIFEGQSYAKANSWPTTGAFLLNVTDPANNVVFSAHCYFDRDLSGTYSHGGSVSGELIPSVDPDLASALTVGERRVKPFVDWCAANNVRGLVGEFGIPHSIDTANWNEVLTRFHDYIKNNGNGLVSATQWGGGAWGTSYTLAMEVRKDNSEPPMMPVVRSANPGPGTDFWFPFTIYANSLVSTADYSFVYPFASSSPEATCTIDAADATTYFGSASSSARSIRLSYTIPAGGYAGAGLHVRGPLSSGVVGGISLAKSVTADHVLSFYAKGTPGANLHVTLGTTLNASGVDSGSDTGTGTWVSLGAIAPISDSWQRYEIPLKDLLSSTVDGAAPIQRLRFTCYPADGNAYAVNVDQITLAAPSTNSAPTVSVDTSTGATNFLIGQNVTLVAQATDPNPGDEVDFVEFYADHETKIGISPSTPYQWSTTFSTPGAHVVTASAFDSHGVVRQSDPKVLNIADAPPTEPPANPPATLTANAAMGQVTLLWSTVPNTDHYVVRRGTSAAGPFTVIANPFLTTYKDTSVINGTTYFYTVSAANVLGESANSVVVSALPLAPPLAPATLTANGAFQRVSLAWAAAEFAASYTVKCSTTSGGPYAVAGTATTTTFNDTAVTNGTTYYYVVSATNSSGESANSAEVAIAPQAGSSIIKDNTDTTGVTKTGTWTSSTFNTGYYGTNYIHDGNTGGTGGKKVVYTPTIPATGPYDVYVRWVSNSGRASNAPIDINHAGGKDTFSVNQLTNSGAWILFGTYTFNAGTTGNVTIRNDGANGFVIADAVMFAATLPSVSFAWSGLQQTYDGTPKSASVTTSPANLSVSLTYNGSATPPTAAGTYTVMATVASGGYVGSAATTLVIEKAPATITLGNLDFIYDGNAKAVSATTTPAGLVTTIAYEGSPDAPSAGGDYTVTATVTDPNYRGTAEGVLHIAAANQTIDFPAPPEMRYGDAPLVLTATATSGLPVSFETASGPAGVENGVVTAAGAGVVTVRALQEGDRNYLAAPPVERSFVVKKALASVALVNLAHTYDGGAKSASVTTTPAGLNYTVTYNGGVSAPIDAGSYTVSVVVDDVNYSGAASGTLVISPATQTISFDVVSAQTFGVAPFALSGQASSGLPLSYSLVSGPATLDGNVLTVLGAGAVTVRATQSGSANYLAASPVEQTFSVAPASQSLSFVPVPAKTFGDLPIMLSATATSGLPVSFQLLSGPATLNGTTLAFTGAGAVVVQAAQAGDSNYLPAPTLDQTITVSPAVATITLSDLSQIYDGSPKTVVATTSPAGLPVQLSYSGAASAPIAPGSYTVVATIADANYTGSTTATLVISTNALVRHAPTLNGRLEGSLQVLSAESFALNGFARVTGDILVPGLPGVQLNGAPVYQGTLDGGGDAAPSSYQITLNGGAQLRHLVRRTNPVTLAAVPAPAVPAGTRDVTLNSANQSAGDFATLRNLTLNGNAGVVSLPPGTYGTLTANGSSGFTLGIAGAVEPAVYQLQGLTLNGNAQLRVMGPVILRLARGITLNSVAGNADHPTWLTFQYAQGGLTLNGGAMLSASVVAPSGTVTLSGNSHLIGNVACDHLVLDANSTLRP